MLRKQRNMKRWIGLTTAAFMVISLSAQAKDVTPPAVIGLWLVKKKDVVVEVKPCSIGSRVLCGHVAWFDPKAKQQNDHLNPNEALRNRPICGIRVMWDMTPSEDKPGVYKGKIYKANNGTVYDATITLNTQGNLLLHGYIGLPIFGKNAILTPVKESAYPLCI